jgi:hypothetical protein
MRKLQAFIAFFVFISVAALTVSGQADGIKPNLAAGDVASINAAENKIVLQTKDGAIDVVLSASTAFKRVPPDNPKLSAAVDAVLNDISAGDKVLVTGTVAADKKSIPAKVVYLITKSDISAKQQKEREEWRARGISGRIVSLDVPNKKIVLATRGMAGERSVTITPKETAEFRRYAPDSVKFDDAKISNYGELAVGDQVRALGDRSADGATFAADKIVSGSFKMVGGTITAIDAAKKEITIKEVQTNKPITIVVNDASMLKKFPAEFAAMFAARMQGGAPQPPGQGGNVTVRPPNQQGNPPAQGGAPNGGMRPGAGGRGEFDDMLERFPAVTLAELKVGDAIAVSSTTGAVPNRVTAIKLLSGVEPFLNAPQMAQGGGRGGQSGGPAGGGFSIPGLDGIGFP